MSLNKKSWADSVVETCREFMAGTKLPQERTLLDSNSGPITLTTDTGDKIRLKAPKEKCGILAPVRSPKGDEFRCMWKPGHQGSHMAITGDPSTETVMWVWYSETEPVVEERCAAALNDMRCAKIKGHNGFHLHDTGVVIHEW